MGREFITRPDDGRSEMDQNDWALTESMPVCQAEITLEEIDVTDSWYQSEKYAKYHQKGIQATVINGKITAKVTHEGWICYYNQKGEQSWSWHIVTARPVFRL